MRKGIWVVHHGMRWRRDLLLYGSCWDFPCLVRESADRVSKTVSVLLDRGIGT